MRVWTMKFLRFGFVLGMTLQIIVSMLCDRATYNPRTVWRSVRRLRRSPIMDKALWLQLKDYDRPDFHPDDRDTTELVTQWRAELFGEQGTLNDKLVTSAA